MVGMAAEEGAGSSGAAGHQLREVEIEAVAVVAAAATVVGAVEDSAQHQRAGDSATDSNRTCGREEWCRLAGAVGGCNGA